MYTLFTVLLVSRLAAPSPGTAVHEPQLAASPGLTVVAFGPGSNIYVATSVNNGQDFGKPVKVGGASVVPLSRHRGPRIAISNSVIVVTAVIGQNEAAGTHAHGLPSDGDLLAWRSVDGGVTWSDPLRVNDVASAPREGLHTLTADGRGNLFAAWLDQRAEGAQLYGAWSSDSGATWSKNVKIYESPDGTICQCCYPTALFNPGGGLDLMWRNVLDGYRDFYLIQANSGRRFDKPEKLGLGGWKINACPMDGGSLVHAGAKTVTFWRRQDEIFMDEAGKPEMKIGEGKDVAAAAAGDRLFAAWIKGAQCILWISGKRETIASNAAYPNVTALPGGGALVAWEENNGISFKRIQ